MFEVTCFSSPVGFIFVNNRKRTIKTDIFWLQIEKNDQYLRVLSKSKASIAIVSKESSQFHCNKMSTILSRGTNSVVGKL